MTALPANLAANPRLSQWITIRADGLITIRTGKVELGQGIVTAIMALAAAELGVSVTALNVVAGDTRCAPNEGLTAGSFSIEHGGAAMRYAAAAARSSGGPEGAAGGAGSPSTGSRAAGFHPRWDARPLEPAPGVARAAPFLVRVPLLGALFLSFRRG